MFTFINTYFILLLILKLSKICELKISKIRTIESKILKIVHNLINRNLYFSKMIIFSISQYIYIFIFLILFFG